MMMMALLPIAPPPELQRVQLHFSLEPNSTSAPDGRKFLAPMVYGALMHQLHHHCHEWFDYLHHEGSGSGFRPWRLTVERPSTQTLQLTLTGLTAEACKVMYALCQNPMDGLALQEGMWRYRLSHPPMMEVGTTLLSLTEKARKAEHTEWKLYFKTPTTFKDKDVQYCPFPTPDKVLGHLFNRFETLYPNYTLEASEFLRPVYTSSRVRMEQMEGQLIQVQQAHIPTFNGVLRWQCKPKQPEEAALLRLLWEFVAYSGVGAKTTQGLGHVVVQPLASRQPLRKAISRSQHLVSV
jgi:CRISPR-associated endoribonuclease Cas6